MALDGSIPTIYSARLRAHLDKALVFAQPGVVNTDYEGEIRDRGDKVKVSQIGRISIGSYLKNTDISIEDLDTDQDDLEITEADYFAFQVDDIDATQTGLRVADAAARDAAYGLANSTDAFLAALMRNDGTPVTPSGSDAYEKLVDLSVSLTELNVPRSDRFAIVTPAFEGLLMKDDRFVATGSAGADSRLANGIIGRAAGFTILVSNSISTGSGDAGAVIAGHPMATSFANQIAKTEAFRMEKRFASALKGLHVYGAKVFEASALVVYEL